MIDFGAENSLIGRYIDRFRIKTPTTGQPVGLLSGGNQQKVVLAKWLATNPKVLIVDEPTRGVDVGTKAEIYALMRELAARGAGDPRHFERPARGADDLRPYSRDAGRASRRRDLSRGGD